MHRLRFGLLYHPSGVDTWHVRCLDHLEAHAELVWAVASPPPPGTGEATRALDWFAARGRKQVLDVGGRFMSAPSIHAVVGTDVDFVLTLGQVRVPSSVGFRARFGVWRFDHEMRATRLPFLDEVYRGDDVTHVALLALDPGGVRPVAVLEEGVFRTDRLSYARGRDRILDAIAEWPARICRRLVEPVPEELGGDDRGVSGDPRGATSREHVAGRPRIGVLALRLAARRAELAWARLFRHPQWNIGVIARPMEELLEPGAYTGTDVEWFPQEGRRGFLADPFGVEHDGGLQVFCEYFDFRDSRGRICMFERTSDGVVLASRPALSLPVHVSYPYLLELPDGLHCVPETAAAREVALYRVGTGSEEWTKAAVLLDDVPGIDPTVFRHESRWWLMCGRKGSLEDEELWVWHAPEIVGPWSPHTLNPVKTDIRGARPAGRPFYHEGALYRPAQDCSGSYGGRLTVHRVKALTPTLFDEELVTVLESTPESCFPHGPHTITSVGNYVLVDGRRTVFVPAALRAFLQIWAASAVGRLRRS